MKLEYSIWIDAAPEKVWRVLWDNQFYTEWSAPLAEGCYYEGDMAPGSILKKLGPDGNGMYGTVEKNIPNKEFLLRNTGWVYGERLEPQDWDNNLQHFVLKEQDGGTSLTISNETSEAFAAFFDGRMPKALENIKRMAEQKI